MATPWMGLMVGDGSVFYGGTRTGRRKVSPKTRPARESGQNGVALSASAACTMSRTSDSE